jgi:hypothetical protein
MDIGRNGVYDSPMATDYYVQRFGFMFGGGRSGMHGLEALQESIDPLHQSHLPSAPTQSLRQRFGIREKKMAKLSPLMVDMKKENKQMRFSRFMAVP